jgi:PD-(D/E)XK nuclease superfamily protein
MSLRFAPYREIAREVAARLCDARGGDPLEAWEEEVIVPSRGMAEAVAEAMLERMPRGFAGLAIRGVDELAKQILQSAGRTPRVASEAERRLAMRTAVRSVEHPMLESRGIAAMLERSYRDVRDSAVALAELAKRVARTRGLRNAKRTETLLRVWGEYERLIARLGCIDPADLLQQATELATAALPMQLLAGFYDMTGAQLQLIEALFAADRIAAVWVPTEAPYARAFVKRVARGGSAEPSQPATRNAPSTHVTEYDTRHDELRGVCARVAELLASGTPAREIGIVARSLEAYDENLLQRFAAEHGFRTTLPGETPLPAHRIGRAAITLLRLRDRAFPRAEVLELVRDGLYTKTSVDVDAMDVATRRARIAGGTSAELGRMRTRPPIVETYIALVAELEQLTSRIDVDFLARLGSAFRVETEMDLAAADRLDAIASLFRRASGWTRELDVASVIDAIEHETLRQPATDNERPVIWSGELLRFRGRSFSHLFVARMQDDVFPQRRTEDPLLPDSDRALLGLREIGDGREEEELLFSLLADATSAELHYSLALGDGMGKVLRKSRFVREISSRSSRLRVEQAHAKTRRREESLRSLQLLAKSATRGVFDGYVGAFAAERLQTLSPTQLEDFGECPQKFLFKHILGATDYDDPERELQIHHREKGIIDHRILERFYRATSEGELAQAAAALPALPRELVARLERVIDEQFDELARATPPFNPTVREIERRATKRVLGEFLTNDIADLDAQQLVPRHFEYRFGAKHRELADHPEPFVIDAGGMSVRVEGTIDRIDAGNDRYRIVDYKSGKALRHAKLGDKVDRGVRLQLALYAMAAAEFFGADPANVSATIKPLVLGDKSKFAFELHEKRETLIETLGIFIRAIARGEFPAFPIETDELNTCKYCPVNHSCRTRHDPEERYALQQLGDTRTLLGGSS